jgi:hypothetical protein
MRSATSAVVADRDPGVATTPRHRAPSAISRSDPVSRTRPGIWPLSMAAAAIGLGLVVVAVADTLSRDGSRWAEPLFWAGMALLWLPPILRIVGRAAGRDERIALLVLLGMALYVVKVLYSPRYFVRYDEFLHWRTAQDIAHTGALFGPNPLLPVSPLYPGLEIATSATAKLTGLSVFVSGTLVIGAARLVLIASLYLLYEKVTGSSGLAGAATAVYFTNPQFLIFDGSYAYESLALSLAVLVLYAVVRGSEGPGRHTVRAAVVIVLPLVATVVTHHITSFALAIALFLLAVISLAFASRSRLWYWGIALLAAGLVLVWMVLAASPVINYLQPQIVGGLRQVIGLIGGEGASRHLFQSYAGPPTPEWDRLASFAFPVIVLIAMPFGWLQIRRSRRLGPFSVLFAVTSLAYPVAGLFRFTSLGVAMSERLSAFAFVPASYCVAMAMAGRPDIHSSRAWRAALTVIAAVLLYGGIALGNPYWARLPRPYLVSGDPRSVEPKGVSAATWANEFLGPGRRIGADRINRLLMMTYGRQWPVARAGDDVDPTPVFFDQRFTLSDRRLLRRGRLDYLVVDYRLTRSLPWLGAYYDDSEPGGLRHKQPIPPAAFAKFDRTAGLSRVFDNGDIAIFDVTEVTRRG